MAWKRGLGLLIWLLGALGSAGPSAGLNPPSYGEYEVKAALLYKLAKFTEWPEEAFSAEPEHLVYCVVGRGPMGEALAEAVEGKTVGGRQVVVRRDTRIGALSGCQVLFLHGAEDRDLARVLAVLGNRPILLVGESRCFASRGGMINLIVEDARIRFEINPARAQEARLRISPNLLNLARITSSGKACDEDAAS